MPSTGGPSEMGVDLIAAGHRSVEMLLPFPVERLQTIGKLSLAVR